MTDGVIQRRIAEIVAAAVALERARWTSGDQPSAISEAVLAERERCSMVAQFFPVETWAGNLSDAIRIRDAIGEAIRKGLRLEKDLQDWSIAKIIKVVERQPWLPIVESRVSAHHWRPWRGSPRSSDYRSIQERFDWDETNVTVRTPGGGPQQ